MSSQDITWPSIFANPVYLTYCAIILGWIFSPTISRKNIVPLVSPAAGSEFTCSYVAPCARTAVVFVSGSSGTGKPSKWWRWLAMISCNYCDNCPSSQTPFMIQSISVRIITLHAWITPLLSFSWLNSRTLSAPSLKKKCFRDAWYAHSHSHSRSLETTHSVWCELCSPPNSFETLP